MYARGEPVDHVDQRSAMADFVEFVGDVLRSVVLVAHNGRHFDFPRFVVLRSLCCRHDTFIRSRTT